MYQREMAFIIEQMKRGGEMLQEEVARPDGPRGEGKKAPIDEEIELVLKQQILQYFPDDAIVCEEGDGYTGNNMRTWFIDPHDGTEDFLNGHRESSISVGLVDHGELVLGAVYAPIPTELTGEEGLFVTWHKEGTLQLNGEDIRLPPAEEVLTAESRVLVSQKLRGDRLAENERLLAPAQLVPCASIATRLALVACGKATAGLSARHPLCDWDLAGGHALLKGSGADVVGLGGVSISWTEQKAMPDDICGYFAARHVPLADKLSNDFLPYVEKEKVR